MNLSFWQQVSESWLTIQRGAEEAAVDLTALRLKILRDVRAVKAEAAEADIASDLELDDDFWGGL